MKKVLYFVPEFPKLSETFIEREISKLVSLGKLDIKVLSLKKASGKLSDNLKSVLIYSKPSIFDCVIGLKWIFKNPHAVSENFSWCFSDGVLKIFPNLILFLKSLPYSQLFTRYNPDHIHAHFLSFPSTLVLFSCNILGLPFSVSGHARDVFVEGSLIPKKVQKATFISICNMYAWSKCVEKTMGENASNILRIYHGVDVSSYLNQPSKLKKPGRPLIFVGSRLVEKKGLKYMIEASRILKERNVDHEIHIVGLGPLYKQLSDMINFLGLKGHVFLPGNGNGLPNEEIMEYFKIADIFAHPSIETGDGDVDGVPTFVIEAALFKLPIVATSAGSISDLIDETCGIFAMQKDAYSLADGIEKLIKDPSLRLDLGEKVYQRAKEMFDLDKNVGRLQELLLKNESQ